MDSVASKVVWSPFSEGYHQNPYPHLRQCRETNPVQRASNGDWYLFRYDHVKEILRAPAFNASVLSDYFQKKEPVIFKGSSQCPYLARTTSHWLPHLNGTTHEVARQLVEQVLLRYDLRKVIDENIDNLLNGHMTNRVLGATTLGATLPVLIFNTLYGGSWSSGDDIVRLQHVSHSFALAQDIFVTIKTYQQINEDMKWFVDTVTHDFAHNLANRPLLTFLNEENRALGSVFTRDELISIVAILLLGTVETSQVTISNIIYELMRNRSLIDHIGEADEIAINILAEEFFRYTAPLQYTIRISDTPTVIDNVVVPAGARLFLCMASANRDPAVFPDPDDLVLDRRNNPHLSFGAGVHMCVGSKLARMEIRAVLKPLAARLRDFVPDATAIPEWHRSVFIRGLKQFTIQRT